MKNKNKTIGVIIAAVIIVAAIILTTNSTGLLTLNTPQEYVIGSIMPLSGDAAVFGTPFEKTINMAVNEINSNGGINGKKLKVIFEDGKCNNKDAVDAASKLINLDNTKVIIGGICSGETLGAAPIAESNKVILFSPASGSPDITNAGDYIFRNMASDAYSGKKIAQATIKNNIKKIAIISENSDYALALANVFTKEYTKLGGKVVINEKFDSKETDFRTIVSKVLSKNPDAIYLDPQTPATFAILLKQLKEMGYNGTLYGNEYTRDKTILNNYPSQIEGIIFAESAFNKNNPLTKELINKLKIKNIDDTYPSYQAKVYDSVYIIKDALIKCKRENTDCIKNYLYSIKNRPGADGNLTINKYGDAELDFVLKTVHNGKIIDYNN